MDQKKMAVFAHLVRVIIKWRTNLGFPHSRSSRFSGDIVYKKNSMGYPNFHKEKSMDHPKKRIGAHKRERLVLYLPYVWIT